MVVYDLVIAENIRSLRVLRFSLRERFWSFSGILISISSLKESTVLPDQYICYIYSYLQIMIGGSNKKLQGIASRRGGEGGEDAERDLDTKSTILQDFNRICELLCPLSLTPVELEKNRLDCFETRVRIFLFPVYCSSSLNKRLVWLASNEPSLNEVKNKVRVWFSFGPVQAPYLTS